MKLINERGLYMINRKFPGYFYQNSVQIQPGEYHMFMDTAFVERYSSYTSITQIADWQNLTDLECYTRVNTFLGASILNKANPLYVGVDAGKSIPTVMRTAFDMAGIYLTSINGMTRTGNGTYPGSAFILLNNCASTEASSWYINYDTDNPIIPTIAYTNNGSGSSKGIFDNRYHTLELTMTVYREDLFKADGTMDTGDKRNAVRFTIYITYAADYSKITRVRITVSYGPYYTGVFSPTLNLNNAQATDSDPDDPYEKKPDEDPNDGGDGEYPPGTVEPTDVPDLPSESAASCGLITMYTPTLAQLQSLGSFLWSGLFDPDTWKKVFTNPMDAIVGLAIVPAVPASGGSKNIMFGNVDSGVSSSYLSTQYVTKNFGSVKVKKDVGSFLDFTDTQISIYLPYLGFRTLSADDVMGATLSVTYNIDVLTGACAAFIKSSARGVMYAYNGSCITNVPLSGQNFSGAIQNAVSTVASGVGVLAGMATGAAPVTAMSAVSMLTSAANVALNSKPEIQRSGNLGGSAGILSVQKPFLIIQRANYTVPDNLSHFVGNVTWKSGKLGSFSGFTMVDMVHLEGITATAAEKTEIESLLKSGVIL